MQSLELWTGDLVRHSYYNFGQETKTKLDIHYNYGHETKLDSH
jgi:hypothetical protein